MSNLPLLYWDSCIFYEHLGKEQQVSATKRAAISAIIDANEASENIIMTSVISHLEVLPEKLVERGVSDIQDYLSLFDGRRFVEVELSTNIIIRAREIRNHYYRSANDDGTGARMMDVGDALHLATATIYEAHEFHTRDDKKKKGNVPLLSIYSMFGETALCGKYNLKIVSPEAAQGAFDV